MPDVPAAGRLVVRRVRGRQARGQGRRGRAERCRVRRVRRRRERQQVAEQGRGRRRDVAEDRECRGLAREGAVAAVVLAPLWDALV